MSILVSESIIPHKFPSNFQDRGKWKKRREDQDEYNEDDYGEGTETDGIPDAAKNDVEKQDEGVVEDEFGAKDYRSQMILKTDHGTRPLWVVSIFVHFIFSHEILSLEKILSLPLN